MKTLQIIMLLGLANFCNGQASSNSQNLSGSTIKNFKNYYKKKDLEQLTLDCQIDTITKSKDSVLIVFLRHDNSIFKTIKEYYYSGYLIKVHEIQDSLKFDKLRDDSTVVLQISTTYYDSLGNVVFKLDKDFDRGKIFDSPDYGSSTIVVTNNPRELYERKVYNSLNLLTTEIFHSHEEDEFQYKRVRYYYNAKGELVDKNEELINVNQFWND